MSKLPQISGKTLVRVLNRNGFLIRRQRGSHVIMVHDTDLSRRCVVPVHGNVPIKPGTLHSILKGAGFTPDELVDLI